MGGGVVLGGEGLILGSGGLIAFAHQASNLKKVLQSVLEYWQDVSAGAEVLGWGGLSPGSEPSVVPPPPPPPQVLGQAVAEHHIPDVVLAAQCADPEQLGRLVRLVLGCAVSCERREGGWGGGRGGWGGDGGVMVVVMGGWGLGGGGVGG